MNSIGLQIAFMALATMLPITAQALNCARATSKVEKVVCTNAQLRRLDRILNEQYRSSLPKTHNPELFKRDQVKWIQQVQGKCTDSNCLKSAYESRIRQLSDAMGVWCQKQMPLFENAWARIGDEGFFEEFSVGPGGGFNSWLHHRPEIGDGEWQSKGCHINISSSGGLNIHWILLDISKSRLRVIDLDPTIPDISRYRIIK